MFKVIIFLLTNSTYTWLHGIYLHIHGYFPDLRTCLNAGFGKYFFMLRLKDAKFFKREIRGQKYAIFS